MLHTRLTLRRGAVTDLAGACRVGELDETVLGSLILLVLMLVLIRELRIVHLNFLSRASTLEWDDHQVFVFAEDPGLLLCRPGLLRDAVALIVEEPAV